MTRKIRVHVCTLLIAFLISAPMLFTERFSAKACPVPQPETLFSLYLNSDLIVVADFTSRKDGEIIEEAEEYIFTEVMKNLTVHSVWKGKGERYFSFKDTEYREKNTNLRQTEIEFNDMDRRYSRYGYPLYSDLTVGERYLFFFQKNAETGEYAIADDISGYRNLNDYELGVYERRIAELKTIIEKKENHLEAITEWLVKCLEEPSTRWDAVMSLQYSFNSLEYEGEEEKRERSEFVIDENFSEYRPEIAESLTDAQKEFISGIVFSELSQTIFENDRMNLYYGADSLAKIWDKPRLAMFAYSIFQSVDKTDVRKTKSVMEYISSLTEDERMWQLVENYEQAEKKIEVETGETGEEESVSEVSSEGEATESQYGGASGDIADTPGEFENIAPQTGRSQTAEVKFSPAEIRERIVLEFVDRYNALLVKNFADEDEEIARN